MRPAGPLRANNADALMPALIAGLGFAVQPDFIVRDALADGRLEAVMPEWSLRASALHFITPPGGPRPARIEVLGDFLAKRLARPGKHSNVETVARGRRTPLHSSWSRSFEHQHMNERILKTIAS